MNKPTISLLQMSMILIGSTGIISHVVILPMLLEVSLRDSWIAILISFVVYIFLMPILLFISNRMNGEQLFLWLKRNFGGIIAYPFIALIILYLFFLSIITLKETLTFLSFYLPMTPKFVIGTIFSLVCFYNAKHGMRSIALTTGILLPFVIVLGFFVMTANFPYKDYIFLKPYLENGLTPIIQGVVFPLSGYVELAFILYFQQHLKTKVRFTTLVWIGLIFLVLTLGPTIGAIVEFGPFVAAKQRYPAFEEWRLVSIGRYIEHLDFLSVYQWFVGSFIRLSLLCFLIPDVLQISSRKWKSGWLLVLLCLVTLLSILPLNDYKFYLLLSRHFMPYSVLLVLFLTVILAFLSLFANKKEGTVSNETN